MNARLESLHMVERAVWRELDRASHDRLHDWRVLTLATIDHDRADARSVVLREVDEGARRLVIYSDARAPKVAQLRAHPKATLVAWSAELSWQLRLAVTLSVEDAGLDVSSRWAKVKMSPSAQDYLAALPPGTPVRKYSPERGTREHFAVITAQVEAVDWLELHADGHRRARFDTSGGSWLAP